MDRQRKTICGSGTKSSCLDICTGLHTTLFVTEYHKRTLQELSCTCNTRNESIVSEVLTGHLQEQKLYLRHSILSSHIFVLCVFTLLPDDNAEMDNIQIQITGDFFMAKLYISMFKDNFFSHGQKS